MDTQKKLKAVDFEATTKYRFDPGFETGGTLGVNYAKVGGRILYFNDIHTFLKRKRDVEQENRPELQEWIARFDANKRDAAIGFWYEIHRGVMESLQQI